MRSAISFRSLFGRLFHTRKPTTTDDADIWTLTDAERDYSDGTFLNSVEQLTEEDVPLSPAAVKKKAFRRGMGTAFCVLRLRRRVLRELLYAH